MTEKLKAIVTGGAGFIGSHLVDLLIQNNYQVTVIDNLSGGHENNLSHHRSNNNFELIEKDICTIQNTDKTFKDVSFVFHLAGIGDIVPSIERPYEYMKTNVLGTVSVLEACRWNNVSKLVYAASSSCYGLAETPTREDHLINPMYPYALSKYQGEQAAFHWNKVYGLPINSIRIFNAYGPRVRTTGAYGAVFGVFFKQKLEKKPFTVVGDGSQSRDFIFVTDVANAFYQAAISPISGEIFNLGAGNPQTINTLVQLLGGGDIEYVPKRPGEPDCTWADISKITSTLNWQPQVNFSDGVRIMLEDIEAWKNAPLWDTKSIGEATKSWFKFMGKHG